ncbi:MAG: gamma-glutamyltransferase [Pseudomonadota bacterium]
MTQLGFSSPQPVRSRAGLVTAPHARAAEAGARVLAEGGDAVEAMIAAAAVCAVVYPHMNGLGGDGFWLIAPADGAPIGLQACGPAAALATREFYADQSAGHTALPTRGGPAALTVAGAVAGWAAAQRLSQHRLGGRIPWSRLLEEAVLLAEEGAPVSRSEAAAAARHWDALALQPGWRAHFAEPSGPPNEGAQRRQPQLAATLRRLVEAGAADFYRGDLARRLAAGLEAIGSPLRLADFEGFEPTQVRPLSIALGAGRVHNLPPPTQGVASLMILALMDRMALGEAGSAAHIHGVVEATKAAFRTREWGWADPTATERAWAETLEPRALDEAAKGISPTRARAWPEAGPPGDTVWLGAVDRGGCAVSYIQSVFWEYGSGAVVGDTGVLWQNRGSAFSLEPQLSDGRPNPAALAPGRLPPHTLNPAFAALSDGRRAAYGCMGGEGQPQTQAALYTRITRFGEDPQAAIAAPRWLLGRTWGASSTSLKLESDIPNAVVARLRRMGHEIELLPPRSEAMGHAGWAAMRPDGEIEGAFDPRSDGAAARVEDVAG